MAPECSCLLHGLLYRNHSDLNMRPWAHQKPQNGWYTFNEMFFMMTLLQIAYQAICWHQSATIVSTKGAIFVWWMQNVKRFQPYCAHNSRKRTLPEPRSNSASLNMCDSLLNKLWESTPYLCKIWPVVTVLRIRCITKSDTNLVRPERAAPISSTSSSSCIIPIMPNILNNFSGVEVITQSKTIVFIMLQFQ